MLIYLKSLKSTIMNILNMTIKHHNYSEHLLCAKCLHKQSHWILTVLLDTISTISTIRYSHVLDTIISTMYIK